MSSPRWRTGFYLTGPYAAMTAGGQPSHGQASIGDQVTMGEVDLTYVPEPSTFAVLAAGLLGLLAPPRAETKGFITPRLNV